MLDLLLDSLETDNVGNTGDQIDDGAVLLPLDDSSNNPDLSLDGDSTFDVDETVDDVRPSEFPWRPAFKMKNYNHPSTIPLPPSVAGAMFSPPDGFCPSYLFDQLKNDTGVKYAESMWEKMSPEEKSIISLLKILKGKDIGLFDQIMQWRWKSVLSYGHKVTPLSRPPTRESSLRHIMKTYGYHSLLPNQLKVDLPNTGVSVNVQRFPFGQMFSSLLTDPVAMQPGNLTINPKDPFCEPTTPLNNRADDHEYGDFNTGECHRNAWERLCRGKPRRLLCEISLFIDKTHLDSKGKHTLEPVLFTIGLFNRQFRNKPEAWRPIGYLPNLDHIAPHCNAEQKQRDYHFLLRILLSELVWYQGLDGIKWVFNFGLGDCPAILEIPVNVVMGDTEGHDKLVARIVNRQVTSTRGQCRYCSCPIQFLGNPLEGGDFPMTFCGPIRDLRNQCTHESTTRLDSIDYKPFHDGMVDVHFSDPERGLHGCCPAELLHAFHMGIAERAITVAFNIRRVSKLTSKKQRTNSNKQRRLELSVEDPDFEASDDEELVIDNSVLGNDGYYTSDESVVYEPSPEPPTNHRKVFNDQAKARVDKISKQLHKYLRWQSDDRLPRTSFSHGITQLTKMSGSERTGVLLILFLIMIIEHWESWRRDKRLKNTGVKDEDIPGYIEESMGPELASNVVKSLFLLLTFDSFLRSESISGLSIKPLSRFLPKFLDQVFRTFNRHEGAGNNLIKNHLFLHLTFDISRFGVPANTNSGIGEMCHKVICKETGRRTNMSSITFERQTARRYVENLSVLRAYYDHPDWTDGYIEGSNLELDSGGLDIEENLDGKCNNSYHSRVLTVAANYLLLRTGKKTTDQFPNWRESPVSSLNLVTLLRDWLLPNLKQQRQIVVYGKTIRDRKSFYCNPSYGVGGWAKQDWCFVNYDDGQSPAYEIPFHLLFVFHLSETPTEPIEFLASRLTSAGYYGIGHYACEKLTDYGGAPYNSVDSTYGNRAHREQYLVHRIPKWSESGDQELSSPASADHPPTLCCISCDSIAGACVAFPDLYCSDPGNNYFFLKPTHLWGDLFITEAYKN
jgi:hypothetical protein